MESYVISVSAGKGCYRHIQIAADATLFDLHTAILDAFEFIDDHAHAFFMDNKIWSIADGYYSDQIENERRQTRDFRLGSLALQPGKRFKYVFDFGDEWVFQCKVLRVSNEPCDTPVIVRSTGEAPDQLAPKYDFDVEEESERRADDSDVDEDFECMDIPEIYTPAKLKRLYESLSCRTGPSRCCIATLKPWPVCMASSLCAKRWRLSTPRTIRSPRATFSLLPRLFATKIVNYSILGKDDLYADGRASAPLDREIVENSLYTVDLRV
jgi:hypothetical protein